MPTAVIATCAIFKGKIMNWNLEGMFVSGHYMGEFPITGRVEYSRVKYGGEVEHGVVLDHPIVVYGAVRERVSLENYYVDCVSDNRELSMLSKNNSIA
jgi:hypothetical protein